jgi:hypothetical protein
VNESNETPKTRVSAWPIGMKNRLALFTFGTSSWLAGGVASFLSANGAGAAALIVTGLVAFVIALMGRWPTRISVSGSGMAWPELEQAIDSQIYAARSKGEDGAVPELTELRDRLAQGYVTGSVPPHPAEIYDRDVEAAIRRLLPTAKLRRQERSREVADFVVEVGNSRFLVETKWRSDPDRPFRGSTLPALTSRLPSGAKLLVVINTTEPPSPEVMEKLQEILRGRGLIIRWRDFRDDPALAHAVALLIGEQDSETAKPIG